MIYAIRITGHHETLVEFSDLESFDDIRRDPDSNIDRQVSAAFAHRWVKDGREHETGLFLDDGEITYASPQS